MYNLVYPKVYFSLICFQIVCNCVNGNIYNKCNQKRSIDIERQTIKFVNRYGGVVVIDVLSRTEIKKLVYDYMKKKSRNDVE